MKKCKKINNSLENSFYKISKSDLRKFGIANIPASVSEEVFNRLRKRNSGLKIAPISDERVVIISPKEFRVHHKVVLLEELREPIHNIPDNCFIRIFLKNPDYLFLLIDFFKNICDKIIVIQDFGIENSIINKVISGETLTDSEKLFLLINFPDIKL